MKLGPHILPGGGAGIRLVQTGATVAKLADGLGLAVLPRGRAILEEKER